MIGYRKNVNAFISEVNSIMKAAENSRKCKLLIPVEGETAADLLDKKGFLIKKLARKHKVIVHLNRKTSTLAVQGTVLLINKFKADF